MTALGGSILLASELLMVLAALVIVVLAVVTIGVDLLTAMRDWPPRQRPPR